MALLPQAEREALFAGWSHEALTALKYDWGFHGRPKQFAPPGNWITWALVMGRGAGKTRSAAEWVRIKAREMPGSRGALVAKSSADGRDVMVEGDSGLLNISPETERPLYEPSKRRLTWPNGSTATLFSAEEGDQLRGPQNHWAWGDEIATWPDPETWDQLMFGLRLGKNPQVVASTTPRPTKFVRELIADPTTMVTRGSTYENRGNLAASFFSKVISKYEGTRLGRQELEAEVLGDYAGALWQPSLLEHEGFRIRMTEAQAAEFRKALVRIVVAVDPSTAADGGGDECGIVVAGVAMCDCLVRQRLADKPELHGFLLEDGSGSMSPNAWARRAVALYEKWDADRIVAEVNQGGALVESALRTVSKSVSYKAVHASKGKATRAEPIAALYESHRCHHVGLYSKLEDELTTWEPLTGKKSPNRLDALVWAFTDLILKSGAPPSWDTSKKFSLQTSF